MNVLIADECPLIRKFLRLTLEKEGISVTGEAGNGVDALVLVKSVNPDLVILDIAISRLDGFQVISRIKKKCLKCRILILTSLSPALFLLRCINAGAHGFVSKYDDVSKLVAAVRKLYRGRDFFPKDIMKSVSLINEEASDMRIINSLSNRELLVLRELSKGYKNKEIAAAMVMGEKNVSAYKQRIMGKLNVNSIVDLAEFSKRHKLIITERC